MRDRKNMKAFEATVREPASTMTYYLWATDTEHARRRLDNGEHDYGIGDAVEEDLVSGPIETERAMRELIKSDKMKDGLERDREHQRELMRLLKANSLEEVVATVRAIVKTDVEA